MSASRLSNPLVTNAIPTTNRNDDTTRRNGGTMPSSYDNHNNPANNNNTAKATIPSNFENSTRNLRSFPPHPAPKQHDNRYYVRQPQHEHFPQQLQYQPRQHHHPQQQQQQWPHAATETTPTARYNHNNNNTPPTTGTNPPWQPPQPQQQHARHPQHDNINTTTTSTGYQGERQNLLPFDSSPSDREIWTVVEEDDDPPPRCSYTCVSDTLLEWSRTVCCCYI